MLKDIGLKVKKDYNLLKIKFLVVKDHNERIQNIVDSISEFLWDSGHEMVKRNPDCDIENPENDDYDYIIKIGDSSEPNNKSNNTKYNNFSIIVRGK